MPTKVDNLSPGTAPGSKPSESSENDGRKVSVISPARARVLTICEDGSVEYGGPGIRISGAPEFIDCTIATLDCLDGTHTGHQVINQLVSNGHTVVIVQNDGASALGGGSICITSTANGFPAGTLVNMGAGGVQVSDGSGSDSTVHWLPGSNALFTDGSGKACTQPDSALLGHALLKAVHNAMGKNRSATPDPADPTGNQEESSTIGINDFLNDVVTENNILRDTGQHWRRTDHADTARSMT